MRKVEFFIPLKRIPTTTHQMKRVTVKNGKPVFYESDKIKAARSLFRAHLIKTKPKEELTGAVRLITKWCFPPKAGLSGLTPIYKTTKPDTDNMVKLLKDEMTHCGYWADDAQVASEITEKFYSEPTGIYIKAEEIR